MTTQELYTKFSQGINWNALVYLIYKVTATVVIILLYNRLDSELFSTYGNINSLIFLLLLWLDFGFQKAIPRFCPEYAQNTQALASFLKAILIFKIIILTAAVPLYLVMAHYWAHALHMQAYKWFFYAGAVLVLTEGLVSVVRLIYHAYFLQKIFNRINAISLLIEMAFNIICFMVIKGDYFLLVALLATKTATSCMLLFFAWRKMPMLYEQVSNGKPINITLINRRFIMHSAIMWFSINIKSLTERNFLLPVFTFIFGPITANMFKVANDGALLFYRIVLKTIGTTDTALFSHILSMDKQDETWQVAFKKLCIKIAALVLPLLGIAYTIYRYNLFMNYNPYVFQLFLIITICFLLEALFSPYERILEVHRSYLLLACAYGPYLIMLITLLTTNLMTSIGLLHTLLLIHGVRLVSALIMVFITRMQYGLKYPVRFALLLSIGLYLGIYIVGVCQTIIMKYI